MVFASASVSTRATHAWKKAPTTTPASRRNADVHPARAREGDAEDEPDGQECARERREREREGGDRDPPARESQDRAEGGTAGDPQDVRFSERVPEECLEGCARHGEPAADETRHESARGAESGDDEPVRSGP